MTEPFTNTTDENCVICLCELDQDCIMTKCYHKFHLHCIQTWEKVSHEKRHDFSCPSCKHNLFQIQACYGARDCIEFDYSHLQTFVFAVYIHQIHLFFYFPYLFDAI